MFFQWEQVQRRPNLAATFSANWFIKMPHVYLLGKGSKFAHAPTDKPSFKDTTVSLLRTAQKHKVLLSSSTYGVAFGIYGYKLEPGLTFKNYATCRSIDWSRLTLMAEVCVNKIPQSRYTIMYGPSVEGICYFYYWCDFALSTRSGSCGGWLSCRRIRNTIATRLNLISRYWAQKWIDWLA